MKDLLRLVVKPATRRNITHWAEQRGRAVMAGNTTENQSKLLIDTLLNVLFDCAKCWVS